ncbi:MAG: hypothetical protein HY401_01660 [Elusimicrobia bacterium]|nr:hypothetical protein [Elusimicrobiota bacterium]
MVAVAVCLGCGWGLHLNAPNSDDWVITQEDESDSATVEDFAQPPYRRIRRKAGSYEFTFGFLSFRRDPLQVRFELDSKIVDQSDMEFGYTEQGLKNIDVWYQNARRSLAQEAKDDSGAVRVTAKTQQELNRKIAEIKASRQSAQAVLDKKLQELEDEYERKRQEYFESRGFKLLPENKISASIPWLVGKNWRRLMPVAVAFERVRAEHNYDSQDVVGAALAMVQTALDYRVPPREEANRRLGGVLPPMTALARGWGDCDTKTAALASILLNWDQVDIVGVGLPGHYLMAIQDIPDRGEAYVEYRGLNYVLIEPAGPRWSAPGEVSDETLAKLNLASGVSIEPFLN